MTINWTPHLGWHVDIVFSSCRRSLKASVNAQRSAKRWKLTVSCYCADRIPHGLFIRPPTVASSKTRPAGLRVCYQGSTACLISRNHST
jgi:hypothetical protein